MSHDGGKLVYAFRAGFSEGDPQRTDLLGGKGASLAAMSRAGFPVPPGFTISAECCAVIGANDGRWPAGLDDQLRSAIQALESESGRVFGQAPRPLLVAVRSGAAASMPGMMDTILNCGLHPGLAETYPSGERFWSAYADHIRMFASSVAGLKLTVDEEDEPETVARYYLATYRDARGCDFPTDPWDCLRQSIGAVFASWNSPRAVAYRRHHDVRGVVGTAVNVQMMFPSERSGVLFTANPNAPAAGEMIIEASWGLGEAVVSGAVTPDIYVLDAASLRIKEIVPGQRPADQPALSEQQILELGKLGQRVEQHFGRASDIEWGLADGKLALLQTRVIRGLDLAADAEAGRLEEIHRLKATAQGERVAWISYNLGETLPHPTPLTWDILRRFMSGRGGFGQLYRTLGFQPSETIAEFGFLELICGRIYADPRRAARLFFGELPLTYPIDDLLAGPQALAGPPREIDLQRADSWLFLRIPGLLWTIFRASRRRRALRRELMAADPNGSRFEQQVVQPLERFLAQTRSADLSRWTTVDLIKELDRRRQFALGDFAAETLLPGYLGGLSQATVATWLTQLMGPSAGAASADRLLSGHGDVTVEQNELLFRVARGEVSRNAFLERFGHRAANEMELSQPRWREDASAVDRMLERFRAANGPSPAERCAEQRQLAQAAIASLPDELARWGGASLRERISEELQAAQTLLPYRELGKFHLLRAYETLRHVTEQLAHRWELGRDIYFLELDELPRFEADRARLREQIERRRLRWRSAQKLVLPETVDSEHLDQLGLPEPIVTGGEGATSWSGRSIAAGQATGVACLVVDPSEAGDLGDDYILICPSTDPGWTPLFVGAKGLIVERGGVLSHGAIVARDFGIPAVVCPQATRTIPNGARLHIDADRGVVTMLAPPA